MSIQYFPSLAIRIFLVLIFGVNLIEAKRAEDQEPIVVQLSNEVELLPLYLLFIQGDESGLSSSYFAQLEKVFRFDLEHNGATYLLKTSPERDPLASSTDSMNEAAWRVHKVYFVVVASVKNKMLTVRLLVVNNGMSKMLEGFQLTGELSQDRRIIHRISDQIHKVLFGTEGIASTYFLYTVKKQDPATKKWLSEVFEADYDGGNAKQITQKNGYCITPSYIPPRAGYRSRSYLFVSYQIGQPKIYLGNLDHHTVQRFSLLKGNQLMPTLSRQRDQVAFISDVTGNPDLFIQEFDSEKGLKGKPRQIFTTYKATQGTPSFHPDGKKIAFVSNKDGSPRIYMMNIPPEGAKLKEIKAELLTKVNKESTAPCWSPDGQKIAYCSMTKGVRQIWIYDFTTRKERQLTQGPGNKENPTWAPNGLHLIFNSSDAGASELYLINLNQPQAVKISQGDGEKHFPSWGP